MIYYKESFLVDGQPQYRNRAAADMIEMLSRTCKHAAIMGRLGLSLVVDTDPAEDWFERSNKFIRDSVKLDCGYGEGIDKPSGYTGGRIEE